jgi:SAM-dependent methyltransferase
MKPLDDQNLAYERAVAEARDDPSMRHVIQEAFLHEDARAALNAFVASEHAARVRRLLREAKVKPGARVLELGGGRGLMSALLSREGFDVVLCEPNPSHVCGAGAARELQRSSGAAFEVVQAGIDVLPPVPSFDAIVCRAVLHHIRPLLPVLRSIRERLTPGGAFLAVDEPTVRRPSHERRALAVHPFVPYGVDERAFTPGHYRRALREAGFVGVASRFPVAYADYRSVIRPRGRAPYAVLRYGAYRLRDELLHPPGTVRAFIGRRPNSQ